MKFATIACLLGLTSGATNYSVRNNHAHAMDERDGRLSQLISSALAGAPPGEIAEPVHANTDTEDAEQTTQGHTRNYSFHWKYACAFTKWTPTNQFIQNAANGGRTYDAGTMTLERFGFIGENKKCYWSMIGVDWVTPL